MNKKATTNQNNRWLLFLGVMIFGLVLPLGTAAAIGRLVRSATPTQADEKMAQIPAASPSPTEDEPAPSFANPSQPPDESDITIPDIPQAYCVPDDTPKQVGQVVAVTDSSTLHVQINDRLVTVSYLGLNSPGLDEKKGATAFKTNSSLEGHTVLLVSDDQGDGEAEILPRYVFSGETFINYQLLEWGLAESDMQQDISCAGFFLAAQNEAESEQLGIWEIVDVRSDPADWQKWPVMPPISQHAIDVFWRGVEAGNDPNHFSVLGDCQAPEWKLFGRFDWSTYQLSEEYAYLQPTIDHYAGQWGRGSITTVDGNTVASLFSVYWADPDECKSGETQIECELRLNNPNLALLMLGTNWKRQPEEFETRLRQAVEYLLARDILPVVVTKADSHGADWPLNSAMAQVAYDYDIPLWNFWLAVQDMPNHGMDPNDKRGIHIVPQAYPVKRMTGLEAIDAVLQAVYGQ